MEPLPQDVRLVRRAFWLIRLRWVAVVGLCATTLVADRIMSVRLHAAAIYTMGVFLALYNAVMLVLLSVSKKNHVADGVPRLTVKRIINFQISADLLILTVLFHFSGGIENPFVVYYVFHMIIASILLSQKESYLQATFASVLLLLLSVLEYNGLIRHYCLDGFIAFDQHTHAPFVFGTVAVVSSALYLAVYMAGSIAVRLRTQEQGYWQANQLLARKDRIKDEYVARVTHDIKGHLAAIKSTLDVVARGFTGPLAPKQQEFVDRAVDRTRVLTEFVKQLLKLTQMRLNDTLETIEFEMDEVIRTAIETSRPRAADKHIDIESCMDGRCVTVRGDRISIEEMITNLIFNSVKYTPEGGRITVSMSENSDSVLVSVADTGIGVPEQELPRIFDEFYRASNARACEKDGSGLGLSIARQIVERHGGQITAESRLGLGTKIVFTLRKAGSPRTGDPQRI